MLSVTPLMDIHLDNRDANDSHALEIAKVGVEHRAQVVEHPALTDLCRHGHPVLHVMY